MIELSFASYSRQMFSSGAISVLEVSRSGVLKLRPAKGNFKIGSRPAVDRSPHGPPSVPVPECIDLHKVLNPANLTEPKL